MEIVWLGRTCFRLKGREGTVITDPVAAATGYSPGKQPAEIVTLSRKDDPETSNVQLAGADAKTFEGPGEYEVRGILVTGIAAKLADGSRNMIYAYEIDGIRIVHLGLPDAPPPSSLLESLDDVDVLLMPVGGGGSLAAAAASDVMQTIDPHIVIPMNYKTENEKADLEPIDRFLSEAGAHHEPVNRLQVTRASVPAELTVTVLTPR